MDNDACDSVSLELLLNGVGRPWRQRDEIASVARSHNLKQNGVVVPFIAPPIKPLSFDPNDRVPLMQPGGITIPGLENEFLVRIDRFAIHLSTCARET